MATTPALLDIQGLDVRFQAEQGELHPQPPAVRAEQAFAEGGVWQRRRGHGGGPVAAGGTVRIRPGRREWVRPLPPHPPADPRHVSGTTLVGQTLTANPPPRPVS